MCRYGFDCFVLDTTERRLRSQGSDVALGARAMELLVVLLERRAGLVTKRELLEGVWPGKDVDENNLATQVGALRRVLGAGAIVTVPGLGYRFGLPASELQGCAEFVPAPPTSVAVAPVATAQTRFGDLEWRPEERRVMRAGVALDLGARAYELLSVLLAERHRIVSKSELLRRAWPGVVVEEDNLYAQVSTLRRVLGNDAIATVPGRGYRFVAHDGPASHSAEPQDPQVAPLTNGALRDAAPATSNLPASAGIVGRDTELAEIAALMSRHRLVTLVGTSGIGKTSLARETAHARLRTRDIGVSWVDLSRVSDGGLVVSAVARSLNVHLGADGGLSALVTALQFTQRIVVLDGAEHLLASVAEVARALLDGTPGTHLLVTSQASLKLTDEQIYRLDTLALPHGPVSVEAALAFGAVALFVQRARAADQRFGLKPENVATVVEICRRLDGLPLAIELAAARVPLFGLQGLAQRIEARFQLLVGRNPLAPPRQRTLRSALDWSHRLLSPAEQRVFRRLGVFVGGFTLERAIRVTREEADDAWTETERLATLVDRSLVVTDGDLDHPRYRLLETPRAYALDQLERAGETAAVHGQHARVMADLCDAMHEAFILDHDDVFLETCEPELENLRAAFAWAVENQAELAVEIAAAFLLLTSELGLVAEGHELVAVGARLVSSQTPPLAVARLWCNQAAFCRTQPLDDVLATLLRGIELMRVLNHPTELAYAMSFYALASQAKHLDVAEALLEEARSIERLNGHPNLQFTRRYGEYGMALIRNPTAFDDLRKRLDECRRIAQWGRSRWALECERIDRALIERDARQWSHAEAAALEVMTLAAGHRDRRPRFCALLVLMQVATQTGRTDEAKKIAGDALGLSVQLARFYMFADPMALLLAKMGNPRPALRFLGYATEHCRRLGAKRDFSDEGEVMSIARASLGGSEIGELLARGAAMSTDDAVNLALPFCPAQKESGIRWAP